MPGRWGLSFPLDGVPLAGHADVLREAEALGYTDAWSYEVDGTDAFTPLAFAAACTSRLRLGAAIANVFTRGPATLAMTASTLAQLAPGRFCLGLGAGSPAIVANWNGGAFERPLQRVRDVATLVRQALSGEKVTASLPTASMQGFRLSRPPGAPVPLFIAALRPGMLRLAGQLADGVILNWLAPSDVPRALGVVREAARAAGRDPDRIEVAARLFVLVSEQEDYVQALTRRSIAGYLSTPVYRAFHEWLGRGPALAAMHAKWEAGDRRGALEAIPREVIDDLFIHGSPERCRERVEEYMAAGITVPLLHVAPSTLDPAAMADAQLAAMRALAPR